MVTGQVFFLGGEGVDTEMEPRAWYVLGEYSTTELYP